MPPPAGRAIFEGVRVSSL